MNDDIEIDRERLARIQAAAVGLPVGYVNDAAEATSDAASDKPVAASDKPVAPPSISVDDAIDDMIRVSRLPIVESPFPTLNEKLGLGGYMSSQVYSLVAGTGRGKTSNVNHQARHFADNDHDVVIAFYEAFAGYNVARMAAGPLGKHSNELILNAEKYRAEIKRVIPDRIHLLNRPTLAGIRLKVDEIADKTGKPPILIVDYEQKLAEQVQAAQLRPDARLAMSEVSTGLLELADQTKAVVIAVSAMNRMNNRRAADVRKLAPYELVDVAKESGAVEYDSAGIIVLSLSNEYEGDERIGTITLAKSRFGQEAHIEARFDGKAGSWRDLGEVEREPDDDFRELIRESLEEKGTVASATEMAKRLRKSKKAVLAAFKAMAADGEIVLLEGTWQVAP